VPLKLLVYAGFSEGGAAAHRFLSGTGGWVTAVGSCAKAAELRSAGAPTAMLAPDFRIVRRDGRADMNFPPLTMAGR